MLRRTIVPCALMAWALISSNRRTFKEVKANGYSRCHHTFSAWSIIIIISMANYNSDVLLSAKTTSVTV